ncbi:hypothetical protein CEE37_04160 [candidate division LCP-89 bacterium B3_LCP]|uniref:PASTA domain-containing protein n=1 Tax=candidate division LCP-89 bacterium B3_LCP TaxID=2012998 RepID=A0A532V3H5_UNCL8|nr:MAG: hypothetical protein CEE37_04160 [candidate division LCP-89 bacterium B3_LCP]
MKQWIIAVFIVLCLYIAGVILVDQVILPFYTRHGAELEVPDIVEMHYAQADSLLREHGFRSVKEREQYDWNYPEGTVISQNPEAYALTKAGRRIYVTLSIGEKLCVMPNLVGKSSRDAMFSAQNTGLLLGDESFGYEYSNYYPENVVMAQSIPPGTKVKRDTPLHATVSLGTLPNEFSVPNLIGQSLDRAKRIILTSGLEIGEIVFSLREDLLPNTVISQFPDPEEKTVRGQLVDLEISTLELVEEEESYR